MSWFSKFILFSSLTFVAVLVLGGIYAEADDCAIDDAIRRAIREEVLAVADSLCGPQSPTGPPAPTGPTGPSGPTGPTGPPDPPPDDDLRNLNMLSRHDCWQGWTIRRQDAWECDAGFNAQRSNTDAVYYLGPTFADRGRVTLQVFFENDDDLGQIAGSHMMGVCSWPLTHTAGGATPSIRAGGIRIDLCQPGRRDKQRKVTVGVSAWDDDGNYYGGPWFGRVLPDYFHGGRWLPLDFSWRWDAPRLHVWLNGVHTQNDLPRATRGPGTYFVIGNYDNLERDRIRWRHIEFHEQ